MSLDILFLFGLGLDLFLIKFKCRIISGSPFFETARLRDRLRDFLEFDNLYPNFPNKPLFVTAGKIFTIKFDLTN